MRYVGDEASVALLGRFPTLRIETIRICTNSFTVANQTVTAFITSQIWHKYTPVVCTYSFHRRPLHMNGSD